MKQIEIDYDDENQEYFYICPYCFQKAILGNGSQNAECEHVVFGYETVNNLSLGNYPETTELAVEILTEKPGNFLESFAEFWQENWSNYHIMDEESDDECPDFCAEKHLNAIYDFVELKLSMDDLIFLIQSSNHKSLLEDAVIAELEDAYIGGGTYYLLCKDRINQFL